MEEIRKILCATERGGPYGDAVRDAEAIAAAHGAETCFVAVAPDEPAAPLLKRAETWGADLLVLEGTKPEARETRLVDAVVRHASCPVLVVRRSPPNGHVVVASDLVDPSLPAVATGVEEARRRHGRVLLVHNVDTKLASLGWGVLTTLMHAAASGLLTGAEESARHRMEDALSRFGARGETLVAHGAPAAAVLRLAVTLPAELLVIGTPGEGSLKTMLFGSVVETVVHWAPCSVLVVPVGMRSEAGRARGPHVEGLLEREAGAAERSLVEETADQRYPVGHAPRR
jgi:nucleotide-binding universal stress UspA family protein